MATPNHPYVRYESRDVSAPAILKYFAALAAAIVVSLLVVSGAQRTLLRRQRSDFPASTSSLPTERLLPPEPRLQGAPGHEEPPAQELQRLRSDATTKLNSYGWTDQKAGIARIPISEAMRMLASQNLPTDLFTAPKVASPKERGR